MKILIKLTFIFLVFFALSCSNNTQNTQVSENSDYKIEIKKFSPAKNADVITLDILIRDKEGKKEIWHEWDNLEVWENGILMNDVGMEEIKNPTIDSTITFSLLIDRTIGQDNLYKMKDIISQFIDYFPKNPIYISFFDETSTKSVQVNKETFNNGFTSVNKQKNMYRAVIEKFIELAKEKDIKRHLDSTLIVVFKDDFDLNDQLTNRSDDNYLNYLIILSDGKYEDDPNNQNSFFIAKRIINNIDSEKIKQNTKIYILTYGTVTEKNENELKFISETSRSSKETKGRYFKGDKVDDLLHELFTIKDEHIANYKVVIRPEKGKIYAGDPLKYQIRFNNKDKEEFAYGENEGTRIYSIGTISDPVIVGGKSNLVYIMGPIIGLLIILVVFLLMQMIIPYTNYLRFKKKYIKKYKPVIGEHSGRVMSKICPTCHLEFEEGDDIVVKCKHTVHLECWEGKDRDKALRYRCPEYPYCSKGYYYYNKEEKFDPDNALKSKNWIVGGLSVGLIIWVLFQLLCSVSPNIFNNFASLFINHDLPQNEQIAFIYKFRDMLFQGVLLGFSLTFLFSWLIEFKEKNLSVVMNIFLRSLLGAVVGFISYFFGALIVIKIGISESSIVDGIPFLIFGVTIGIILSIKTEIQMKNGVFGGIIGSTIGFVILFFTAKLFGSYSLLIAFMFNSAILGASIAMVHRIAENYYLILSGERIRGEREIAIHKWMSALGGRNQVRIGNDRSCTIQMNWDRAVTDEEVVLFVNNDVPYCKAVTNGVLLNGRLAQPNQEIQLSNGVNFTIGETTFTYIEKELPTD